MSRLSRSPQARQQIFGLIFIRRRSMSRPVISLGLGLSCSSAFAVDGVGLGEMFPVLSFLIWATVVALALFAVFHLVKSDKPLVRTLQSNWFLAGGVLVTLLPYAYGVAGGIYAGHLCKNDAMTAVLVSPTTWKALKVSTGTERQEIGSGALISQSGVLLESRLVSQHGLGVWQQTHRLSDPALKRDLMVSSAYFSTRISRPYGCGQNDVYWKTREQFAKMARIEYRSQ
jgi:hypothetical protein